MTPHLRDLPSLAVRRPVLTVVMNLLIVIAGLAALGGLEVRELPDVDRPVVTVRANWPGASPETMDAQVTSVLEGAVARVSGLTEVKAASEENNCRVRLTFSPSVDLNVAANDVREAIAGVERQLPDGVEDVTVVKADADGEAVVRVSVLSDSLSHEELTRLADDQIATELAAVPGVATVELYGDREQVLRIIAEPLRMASYGLSVDDLADVLRQASFDVPAGSFKSADHFLIVRADASVWRPEDLERLEVAPNVRLGDVARAVYGPADADSYVRLDGRTIVGLAVVRQAQSNTIAISDGVRAAVAGLNRSLDEAEVVITSDDALFIRGAVREVLVSLGLAVVIVIGMMFLFFGALRPTLIPATTIPVALAGTLGAIWLLGFSVNILTLLALVLATGLIVDDAIVVLENIQRRRAHGMKPLAGAVLGTRQVFFAVIATTATLISVMVPIAFLPGTAGRLFTEFGFILAVAVAISSFVALTLAPMLAARLPSQLRPRAHRNLWQRTLVPLGTLGARVYHYLLEAALAARLLVLGLALAGAGGAAILFLAIDRELVPEEDRGVLMVSMQGPDGVGLDYMDDEAAKVEHLLKPFVERGEVERIFTMVGRWDPNRALIVAPLTPWEARHRGQAEIQAELNDAMATLPGASSRLFSSNSLNLRGLGGGLEFALQGTDYKAIAAAADTLTAAIRERLPGLRDLRMDYQPTQPQLSVHIDRRRADDLGVDVEGIGATLRAMVDGYEVAELSVGDRRVPIMLESEAGALRGPEGLNNLFVRGADGRMVALSSFIDIEEDGVAAELDRVQQRRAIEIDAELAVGANLGEQMDALDALADAVLPPGIRLVFTGEAATLSETAHDVAITFGIAVLVVLLVLAAQFESALSAVVVVLTVPFGIAAAVFALALTGTSVNVYSQIGLVLLVGLMAKNGILIVEFADQLRDQGLPVAEAVREAAQVRLRPVMMTMLSTVLGGLPLILGSGPGAEARAAIGWVVFGGLGIATLFTLFLIPVIYSLLAPLAKPRAHAGERLVSEMRHAETVGDPLSGGGTP